MKKKLSDPEKTHKVFLFKVLWSKTSIGVAINQKDQNSFDTPLTSFYFWPREDGWKLLKAELDSKPWMTKQLKDEILNNYTHVLSFWLKNVNQRFEALQLRKGDLNLKIDFLGVQTFN